MTDDLDFLIRYRFPRPISRAYESTCFALDQEEVVQRGTWSANVAVRFLAMLYQGCVLDSQGRGPVNPPSHHDFKRPCVNDPFPRELGARIPTPLLILSGIYEGQKGPDTREALMESLREVDFLARYRLVTCEPRGLRVLLGPRIEYVIPFEHPPGFVETMPQGTIMLMDPSNGRFLVLNPLAFWYRHPRDSFGHLYVLRRVEGSTGHYIEDGIAGSPSIIREIQGIPRCGVLALPPDVLDRMYSPSLRFKDGQVIDGRYRINGLIWRGGASDIFAARRLDTEGRIVLKTYESDEGRFDANYWHFINEERLSASVNHVSVVKPIKVVIEGCGIVYEQRYIPRGSLQDLLDANGVLIPGIAQDIAARLLDILHDCHTSSVVHNDVKPDNILFDDDRSLRLIDFGIAQEIGPGSDRLRHGSPPGSRGYMAPEIIRGGFPSFRSDIFSAGVVLAQMLSARLPVSPEELRTIRGIPVEFMDFLEKCLAADPNERFDSALEAAAFLRNVGVRPARCITLDIEGTLVNNSYEIHPRPGLHDFITFCLDNFERVFIYTTVEEPVAAKVFSHLAGQGALPEPFLTRYEYVSWDPRAQGPFKDLRRCLIPLELNCIVDDSPLVIPEDQTHRWVQVREYNEIRTPDRGLYLAMEEIRMKFAMP